MLNSSKSVSVSQAAALCHVGRTTVGYWVRSGKLFARREGRSYAIPVDDLLHFLSSTGQPIPLELGNGRNRGPVFKSMRTCWQYWQDQQASEHRCERCIAFLRQVLDCFCVRENGACGCPLSCRDCRYFEEMIAARFQFIHQIDFPAAVLKGLNLWGGNRSFAELSGLPEESLIGMGIERIIHPSSLAEIISTLKRIELGETANVVPTVCIRSGSGEKRLVRNWMFALREPEGAFLMLAWPVESGSVCETLSP